jgi:hypothetical protein
MADAPTMNTATYADGTPIDNPGPICGYCQKHGIDPRGPSNCHDCRQLSATHAPTKRWVPTSVVRFVRTGSTVHQRGFAYALACQGQIAAAQTYEDTGPATCFWCVSGATAPELRWFKWANEE